MADEKPLEITFVSGDTFRDIFQTSAEGIIMIDESGKILLANPVSEQLFGYEPGSLIGRSMEELLPERYRSKHHHHRKHFNDHPSPRRMGSGRDLQACRLDGTEFPVEISLSYTLVSNQMLSIAFITDITQRKLAEDALKKSEEQLIEYAAELEKKVHSRTEALNLSVQKLEKANRDLEKQILVRKQAEEETRKALEKERELNELKSKFVSIASHEFRTPLSSILSSVSLIHQYKERAEYTKLEKHIDRIKSSVNHLTSILNDFLSLGKLEEGRIEVTPELVMLPAYFDEIHEEMRPVLKEGQKIVTSVVSPGQDFFTDPRILRGALFNLVSNASKYSDPGKSIYLEVAEQGNVITMVVRDEGIGIPESEIKHVFDRFFRATNASNIQGTGLGLNIVKRYIDLLGGTISFDSIEGKGSTFTITLPL